MTDLPVSRRLFLSSAAVTPALAVSDRIAEFIPPPERVRIVTAVAQSVVPAPQYNAEEVKLITSQGKNVELIVPKTLDELHNALSEVEVVFGALNPEMFAGAKNLRWLQATEAGVDRLLFPELVKSNVVVTNMARMFAPAISETAIGMLLSLTRGLVQYYVPQFQKRTWKAERNLVEIDGMTAGIVGMGGIGQFVATKLHYGFNMKILATDAKPMAKPFFVDTLREPGWFMEMVPQVDILVGAAPATLETANMFNEKVFRSMKKTAYFLGLSRGALTDEAALARALKEGWIAGAGLDVAKTEPLPTTSPLWDCPNLIITCHSSGFAPQRRVRLIGLLADNVRRYSSGLPLLNVVDKQRGY
ncbi:MAG: D-2-hydroxyacid dehydrogenase [Bryobacteraceae bacterium]|jgi:phosphoglycerate dehydrogenase-like enzyme